MMVSLKRNNKLIGCLREWPFLCFFAIITIASQVHVCVRAQEDSKRKEQIKEVKALVKEVLSGNNSDKIERFNRLKKQVLSEVPNVKVLQIYKMYRSDLLTDSYNLEKKFPSRGELHAIRGMLKLMDATNAEDVYQLLDKDVNRIKVINFNKFNNGWLRLHYISILNCARNIFKALIGKYGAEKLVDLSQRLIDLGREELLVILLYKYNQYGEDLTSEENLNFIEAYSRILAEQNIQISDEIKKKLPIESIRSKLLNHIHYYYVALNSKKEGNKAIQIFKKYGILKEVMKRIKN